jgi:hypothetical protein
MYWMYFPGLYRVSGKPPLFSFRKEKVRSTYKSDQFVFVPCIPLEDREKIKGRKARMRDGKWKRNEAAP